VSHSNEDTIFLFGYGIYVGDEVPPPEIQPWMRIAHPNPKIILDNGKVIWGCECWWGSEEAVKKQIGTNKVVMVDIDEARAKAQET